MPATNALMSDSQFSEIARRLDRLEATLIERRERHEADYDRIVSVVDKHEIRLRDVEMSQARLLALVGAGGGIGGVMAGSLLIIARALGVI